MIAARTLDSFSCSASRPLESYRLLQLARLLVHAGRCHEAVAPLRRAVLLTDSYRPLTAASRLLKSLEDARAVESSRVCRIAIIGNAIFDFEIPVLRVIAFAHKIDLVVLKGAYNQFAQETLDSTSELYSFKPEAVIVALNSHYLAFPELPPDPDSLVSRTLDDIAQIWDGLANRLHCHVFQHNFVVPEVSPYGSLSGGQPGGTAHTIRRLNMTLLERAARRHDVTVLDIDQIASLMGKQDWNDERMWLAAKQYPASNAIGPLATHYVAAIRALVGLAAKCVVLDLDNTLWGGVIGEDKLEGIRLGGSPEGDAFVRFQRYLQGLRARGILLAVCSKNDESDARAPFLHHPETVLGLEDFSAFVANWKPKAENIRVIAERLSIGIDSLVFIDDNPAEREAVRRALPDIHVPEMPGDPALFVEALHRTFLFETLSLTSEDTIRHAGYKADRDRDALKESVDSLEEYLSSLQMQIYIHAFDKANLPRIAQLINKTNQFNLTTWRMTAEQLLAYTETPGNYTQFLRLRDRFGESGITGILMASPEGRELRIDQWLLSCRILGRRIEEAMLASVWNYARSNGFAALLGVYAPTARNTLVAGLYERLGFTLLEQRYDGSRIYRAALDSDRSAPDFFLTEDSTSITHAI